MFWQISFWLLVVILVLPFPFKVLGYIKGADDSKLSVKIEESANAIFMSIGLFAFYGYINDQIYLNSTFWQVWLIIGVLWSIFAIFWSPKLAYATELMGKNKMRIAAGIGCFLYIPLFLAVYFYAF
ncbi:hypothetical protein [Psychromonas sp.]|uniref:hypothetical protein n=1 Tax=Psychromonas sp. TaxID=1884585 RepID=UPI0039E5E9A7